MKQLAKLQHTFQDCVLQPNNPAATAWISASGRASPEIQLSVYTHAYRARLKEIMANDFPAVLLAVGDDQFNQITEGYIQAHPSHYYSVRAFGRHLPDFISGLIEQHEDYQGMFWLYELALFEWTLGLAFDAADATLFSEQEMAAIPPETWFELKFIVHPSVHRLNFEWNIIEMWRALTDDNPRHVSAKNNTASSWLIWREELITRFRSMQADEQLAWDKIRHGANFSELCEALSSLMDEDDVPLRAASLLKSWIAQGLISKIYN